MTPRKLAAAFQAANIPHAPATREHILRNIKAAAPAEVLASLTSKQLAALISSAALSYQAGRESSGDVEVIDGDAVWIGLGVNRLIPMGELRTR